jgi:hypothetical protein
MGAACHVRGKGVGTPVPTLNPFFQAKPRLEFLDLKPARSPFSHSFVLPGQDRLAPQRDAEREDPGPFGSLAIPEGPMALRPTLADGLPLSRNPAAGYNPASQPEAIQWGECRERTFCVLSVGKVDPLSCGTGNEVGDEASSILWKLLWARECRKSNKQLHLSGFALLPWPAIEA